MLVFGCTFLSAQSNFQSYNTTSDNSNISSRVEKLKVAPNPVKDRLVLDGVESKINMAFIVNAAGQKVQELRGAVPSWLLSTTLREGRYFVVLFAGDQWMSVPFEYFP